MLTEGCRVLDLIALGGSWSGSDVVIDYVMKAMA